MEVSASSVAGRTKIASGTTAVAVNVGGGMRVSVGSGVEVNDGVPVAPHALKIITITTPKITSLDRTNMLQNYKVPLKYLSSA